MKFCGECGTKLGAAAEPVSKPSEPAAAPAPPTEDRLEKLQSFIPKEMSEKILKAREEIEGERRNVTVLFSDVSGFTAMSEKLDPEEVYGIMNDCFKELVEIIYKYEGVVDKFIGDAIMALFGAPLAHEDDPERSVRAALEMQIKIKELSTTIEERSGFPIQMRVGINTGAVVAGSVGSDLRMDYTVMGDTVNLASRMESAAKIGSVLISEHTHNLVQHAFDVTALPPITVKGKAEPINVFEVNGLKKVREEFRTVKSKTPLVGRKDEMDLLKTKVDELNEEKGSVVSLVGDAGIGKSRLAEELSVFADEKGLTILEGKCLSYQTSISYGIFQDLLSGFLGFGLQDSDESITEKIANFVENHAKLKNSIPLLSFLFSIENEETSKLKHVNAEQIKKQTISTIKDLLITISSKSSVLIILDDLQWVDSISAEVIEILSQAVSGKRILLLCISRPPANLINKIGDLKLEHFYKTNLPPLTNAQVKALFKSLMKTKEIPKGLADTVLPRAEGNPLYIEELFRVMVDENILRQEGKEWVLESSISVGDAKISPTIQGLMMSRVDRLSDDDKKTLQCAAVIGKSFTFPILSSIASDQTSSALELRLKSLEENGFLEAIKQSSRELEYSFTHILIQDAVYQSLLIRRRLALHSRVAEAIENIYPKKLNEMVDLLAYHYSQSENYDKAIDYSIKAGHKATKAFANQEAMDYFNKALTMLEKLDQPDQKRLALDGLAQVMFVIGDYGQSIAKYEEALKTVQTGENSELAKASLLEKIGKSFSYMGKFSEATEALEQALNMVRTAGNGEIEKARTLSTLGWVRYNLGNYQEGLQACLEASKILDKTDFLRDMASTLNITGAIYYDLGNWDEAVNYYRKSLEIVEKIGDLAGISACRANLGLILCDQNKLEEALEHHKKSLNIEQKMGNSYGIALSLNNMGIVHLASGEWAKATRFFKRALDLYKSTGAKDFLPEILLYLAEIEMYNANFSKANSYCEEALALSQELESKHYEAKAYRIFGTIKRYSRDFKGARSFLDKGLEIFSSLNMDLEIGRTLLQRAILLRRQAGDGGANIKELITHAKLDLAELKKIFQRLGIERDLKIADEEMKELEELEKSN